MSRQDFHRHPVGIRFAKKTPHNYAAVTVTQGLRHLLDYGGWISWYDSSPFSDDGGLWVLMNTTTGDTYVQKRT